MKNIYLLICCVFGMSFCYGQEPLIMTFEVFENLPYVTIPVYGDGNNYTVDFGDGQVFYNQTGTITYSYENPGTYTVTVSGTVHWINFGSLTIASQIKTLEQWGDMQWLSMEGAFKGCNNLTIAATDVPDLSMVTSMKDMFNGVLTINQPLNNWDVSTVTNMEGLFRSSGFNQPLNNWDVSSVTNMAHMFHSAESFNYPIGNWNVSSVTNMEGMFSQTYFNQPIADWDVSSVTNMKGMFEQASAFNQSIDGWDVSSVTNMQGMFKFASSFNQPVNDWDVSSVTDMSGMFYSADDFDQPLNNWNVSAVATIQEMFYGTGFNQPLNNWDVSSVTNMQSTFESTNFNQPLNNWDVSSVVNMSDMFSYNNQFNQELDDWDVSSVTDMQYMFYGAGAFNQQLNNWNVSSVTNMQYMFNSADAFNQPLNSWDVSNVLNMIGTFMNTESFDQDLSEWTFNQGVSFSPATSGGFLYNSVISTNNYDALLYRFAELGLQNKYFRAAYVSFCDAGVREYLIDELGWTFIGDSLGENCVGNSLTGNIRFDESADGCDVNDIIISNILVTGNDGTYSYTTMQDGEGGYNLTLQDTSYVVTLLNLPPYISADPVSPEVTFTGFGNSEVVDFCLTANQQVNDLNVTLVPVSEARPGFEAQYQLVVQNIGTQTVANAIVGLEYNTDFQSFVNAAEAPVSNIAGLLSFNISSLQPFEIKTIVFSMLTAPPPTVNGGDVLEFTATVTPDTDDYTHADNTFLLAQTVVNAFDPNDKQVLQGSEITLEQAQGSLDYVVRFQNTGSASAITVRIEDIIDEKLDWTTFMPLTSSHNYKVEITESNNVNFIFNDINLPYEASDEPGSHGFVAFKIKPVDNVAVGDVINGQASIYFDYNAPIITNMVSTEIVAPTSNTSETIKESMVSVFPNPTDGLVHIKHAEGINVQKISIINLQGRILMSKVDNDVIDVSGLSPGMYMVSVKTDKGTVTQKLIRK
ncbi:BspA family leucine-rich repeat surface protein [Flavobacterium sp. RHBU_3]|uniref:BspA family leucine-rich repeat surface protein n=1 Tax=Flavobacterium sp. RHBU_3 TaxID=3391184 RepID=UPI003984C5C3